MPKKAQTLSARLGDPSRLSAPAEPSRLAIAYLNTWRVGSPTHHPPPPPPPDQLTLLLLFCSFHIEKTPESEISVEIPRKLQVTFLQKKRSNLSARSLFKSFLHYKGILSKNLDFYLLCQNPNRRVMLKKLSLLSKNLGSQPIHFFTTICKLSYIRISIESFQLAANHSDEKLSVLVFASESW